MSILIKFFILNIFLILSFTSCTKNIYQVFDSKTYKDTFNNLFDKSKTYRDTIQFTKKADITNEDNNIEAMMNVTYLNPTSKEWDSDDIHNFIIGVYSINNNIDEYKLTINNSTNYKKLKITKKMNILGSIPIENKWAKYYLIQISKYDTYKVNKDKLILKLTHKKYKECKIEFVSW